MVRVVKTGAILFIPLLALLIGQFSVHAAKFQQKELSLSPVCSPEPEVYRVWLVRNLTNKDVSFHWVLLSGIQRGSGTVAANGETYFNSTTESGANTLSIFVGNQMEDTRDSDPSDCTPTEPPTPTITPIPPTSVPTVSPQPTLTETLIPSETPIELPTDVPTEVPTDIPTETPVDTIEPSPTETAVPTEPPTEVPTELPTELPTDVPTELPTAAHTSTATLTDVPRVRPTAAPNETLVPLPRVVQISPSPTSVPCSLDPADAGWKTDLKLHGKSKLLAPGSYQYMIEGVPTKITVEDPGYYVGVVYNSNESGRNCTYPVGFATYHKFDEVIDNQILQAYDWPRSVEPGQYILLQVPKPECSAQLDMFFGDVLMDLVNKRYGQRLLDWKHVLGQNYCAAVRIKKQTNPQGHTQAFGFTIPQLGKNFTLQHGQSSTWFAFAPNLIPMIQVDETPVQGWQIDTSASTCTATDGSNVNFQFQATRLEVTPLRAQKINCTVVNRYTPPTSTAVPTATFTPTWTAEATATHTFTPTSTATETPVNTAAPSFTPTFTETPTFTATATFTETPTFTATATFTETPVFTATPSSTPTFTETPTFTATATFTEPPTFTATATFTETPTATETPEFTATPSFTPTFTATFTETPTYTPTATFTATATATFTFTPTATPIDPRCTYNIAAGDVYGAQGLIWAINQANLAANPDVICLTPLSTYTLVEIVDGFTGLPTISSPITVLGFNATIRRETTAPPMRLFNVATVGELQIETVTLTGGNTTSGGAIANNGKVTLLSVTITGNEASSSGGGVYNLRGQLTITNSTIRNNRAQVGGGIYSFGTQAVLRLTGATIRENVATSIAGGIFNFDGDAQINTSVIRQNTANVKGGGVQNANTGIMRIFDSNITENNATSFGGGVSSDSPNLTANRNCIFANISPTGSNAYRDVDNGVPLDMRSNWWGRNTGPTGSEVVGNITFTPVLTSRPATTCPASSLSGGPVTEEK